MTSLAELGKVSKGFARDTLEREKHYYKRGSGAQAPYGYEYAPGTSAAFSRPMSMPMVKPGKEAEYKAYLKEHKRGAARKVVGDVFNPTSMVGQIGGSAIGAAAGRARGGPKGALLGAAGGAIAGGAAGSVAATTRTRGKMYEHQEQNIRDLEGKGVLGRYRTKDMGALRTLGHGMRMSGYNQMPYAKKKATSSGDI